MTVHRVAWRLEKPRHLSWSLVAVAVWVTWALLIWLGVLRPDAWFVGLMALFIAGDALYDHLNAWDEYRTGERFGIRKDGAE